MHALICKQTICAIYLVDTFILELSKLSYTGLKTALLKQLTYVKQ